MGRKLLKTIYYLFLVIVAIVALLLIFSAFPLKGNYKSFVVLSSSMEPKVKMGSVAVVRPEKDYKIGDIITFGAMSRTESPTTHRIAEIKNENGQILYVTKGDANNAPDQQTVREREILGKVLFSVPYAGYAVAKAKTPVGFLLIVIVPSVVIIYEEIRNIAAEVKKYWARRRKKPDFHKEGISNVSFETENNLERNIQPVQRPLASSHTTNLHPKHFGAGIKKPRKIV